jgi:hypothetical protein
VKLSQKIPARLFGKPIAQRSRLFHPCNPVEIAYRKFREEMDNEPAEYLSPLD